MNGAAIPEPDRRRLLLSPDASFNGVDFAVVRDGHRARIDVHFINRVRIRGTLARARAPVTLTGGGYPPELFVHPIGEDSAWSTDTSGRPVLHLTADVPDLGSRYTLTVHSDRVDPYFRSAPVTFPGADDDDIDCTAPPQAGPAPVAPPVPIDYLSKDFASFCQALSNFSAARYPEWVERSEADFGVMLMELLSALADELSYLQDRVAAEATLDTATQRLSLVQHARLIDYEPDPAFAAMTVMQFDVAEQLSGVIHCQGNTVQGETVRFAAGTSVPGLTLPGAAAPDQAGTLDPRWNRYDEAGSVPQLAPYLWDPDLRYLRQGATSMWISGHGHGFYPGQELLIDTAGAVSGDSPLREVVRVTEAEEDTDPVRAQPVTLIRWADRLTSDHDLTRTEVAGNLLPAMQGRVVEQTFAIPGETGPAGPAGAPVPLAAVRADHPGSPAHYLYSLAGQLAWQPVPAPDGGPAQPRPALVLHALTADSLTPAEAAPDGEPVAWTWVPRLLDADGTAQSFTITPEQYSATRTMVDPPFYDYDGDGATIRFGDGTFGLPPVPGSTFQARYLAGGGAAGNTGADTIVSVAPGDPADHVVWRCTNPFPAAGGVDAETRAQIRDRAPQQIKAGLLSLTGAADYQAAALSFSPADGGSLAGAAIPAWARQATAAFRWTGSWPSALTIVDPLVAEPVGTQLSNLAGLAELLNAKRLAGSDSSVALARYRWLDLRITCRAEPAYRRGDVAAAVLARLDPRPAPDGTTGFFGRDRWTFGQPLEASALIAAIQSCPEVAGVGRIEYRGKGGHAPWRRLGVPARDAGQTGGAHGETVRNGVAPREVVRVGVAPSEILRIDNDKDQPQHGLLFVIVEAAP